ncbi:O-antigen ligase family protein [Eubacterium callanderi]|uniref:O-antigen ligase family protein n=5 Tax=Eubacteriaceae TaxID=186806 RepID=UPI00210F00A8|nr:O-antigen ligase family protein [Eubacterium callanderi]
MKGFYHKMEKNIKKREIFTEIFLIIIFFPIPSQILGYGVSLYLNEIFIVCFLLVLFYKRNYTINFTGTIKYLFAFLCLNFGGIIVAIVKGNTVNLNVFSGVFRIFLWVLLYNFFLNYLKKEISSLVEISRVLKKTLIIVLLLLLPFIAVELFDLPGKIILEKIYEMSKSGNIFQFYNRIVGPFRNPNFFGVWISIVLIYFLIERLDWKFKVFFLLECLIFIYFSGSRTAFVVSVFSIIFIIFTQNIVNFKISNLRIFLTLAIVFLIVFYLSSRYTDLFYSVRFQSNNLSDWYTLGGRDVLWNQYDELIKENMIIGNGLIKNIDIIFDNIYLQYIFYFGLPGLIILGLFLVKNFLFNLYLIFTNRSDIILLFCLGIQMIIIISGFTIQILDATQISVWYWFALAYIDYYKEKKDNKLSI